MAPSREKLAELVWRCKGMGLEPSESLILALLESLRTTTWSIADPLRKKNATAIRTIKAFERVGINIKLLYTIPRNDRHALALEATYLAIVSFFNGSEHTSLWRAVSRSAPRRFATMIAELLPPSDVDLWGLLRYPQWINEVNENAPEELPSSPHLYLSSIRRHGMTAIQRMYPSLKREHLYFLFERLERQLSR